MFDARPCPLVLVGLAALAVATAVAACDPDGGGADLTTPGIVTDSTAGGGGLRLLRLTPVADTVRLGGTARFTATFLDTLRPRPDPAQLRWSVADTALAVVDDTGAVRLRRPGVTTVRAALDTEPPATASLVILDTIGASTAMGLHAGRR